MKPILFAKDATNFNTNGLGTLDAISCLITEERNGVFELELTIAEASLHASEIEMTSIILAKVPDKQNKQAFRVYKITKPINGIFKVYAQHVSYQLSFIPCMPFSVLASSTACNDTLQGLKTNAVESCPFTFLTDVTTVASYTQEAPASIRSRLGGVAGSVLDQFGGEFDWDNYTVSLLAHRGVTVPQVTLRYGKNITDLNQEENIADTITGIVPYWQSSDGETTVTLPEKVINSPYAASYPYKRTVPFDFSQAFDEEPTQAQLRAKAQAYMNASGVGVPKVSIKLSFVELADTEEYKDIAPMQQVKLCDNVSVFFEKLNISTTAEVVKYVYDVLLERYDSVEIGSLRSTLSSTINANSEGIKALDNNTRRMFKSYSAEVSELVDEATAWLTSGDGYVVATKDNDGNWKEILFMDTPDVATAVNVLRINQNGIGFSSTGVAGPYTQAWTLDGKMVIGGTNAPSITVYDNATPPNILFQISAAGMQWNAANSSMTAAGVLTANGATLQNAIIESIYSNRKVKINEGRIVFGDNDAYIDYDRRRTTGSNYATVLTGHSDNYIFLENENNDYVNIYDDEILLSSGYNVWSGNGPHATLTLERGNTTTAKLEARASHYGSTGGGSVEVSSDGGTVLYGASDVDITSGSGAGLSLTDSATLQASDDISINSYRQLSLDGSYGISLHSNYGNITMNGNVPIYDIGMGLTITTSYPSGYALVDYFYTENDTWYVGIDYSVSPVT